MKSSLDATDPQGRKTPMLQKICSSQESTENGKRKKGSETLQKKVWVFTSDKESLGYLGSKET